MRLASLSSVLAAMLLTACTAGTTAVEAPSGLGAGDALAVVAASDDVEAALAAGAEAEGTVVLYASGELEVAEGWAAGFRAAHPGVEVEYVHLGRTSDLIARLQADAATGARTADVVYSVLSSLATVRDLLAVHHGTIVPDGFPASAVSEDAVAIRLDPYGVAWNRDLVPAGFDPRGWEDFLEPVHAGCTNTASETWVLSLLADAPDIDLDLWFPAFLANGGVMSESTGAQVRRLASGEIACSLTVGVGDTLAVIAEGAPLEVRTLDPTPMLTQGVAVLEGTASPHAAALLARWIAGPGGAAVVNPISGGISLGPGGPVAPGLEAWADPTDPIWSTTTLLDLDRVEELNATVLDLIRRHHTPFLAG